jgi:hypothetical protein
MRPYLAYARMGQTAPPEFEGVVRRGVLLRTAPNGLETGTSLGPGEIVTVYETRGDWWRVVAHTIVQAPKSGWALAVGPAGRNIEVRVAPLGRRVPIAAPSPFEPVPPAEPRGACDLYLDAVSRGQAPAILNALLARCEAERRAAAEPPAPTTVPTVPPVTVPGTTPGAPPIVPISAVTPAPRTTLQTVLEIGILTAPAWGAAHRAARSRRRSIGIMHTVHR